MINPNSNSGLLAYNSNNVDITAIIATNDNITDVNLSLNTITIAGKRDTKNAFNNFLIGYNQQDVITYQNSTGNNGDYTVLEVLPSIDGLDTVLLLKEPLSDGTIDGDIIFKSKAYIKDYLEQFNMVTVEGVFKDIDVSATLGGTKMVITYLSSQDGENFTALLNSETIDEADSVKTRPMTMIANEPHIKIKMLAVVCTINDTIGGTFTINLTAGV